MVAANVRDATPIAAHLAALQTSFLYDEFTVAPYPSVDGWSDLKDATV